MNTTNKKGKQMKGLVIKNISNAYEVLANGKKYLCSGVGKVKSNAKILVGDNVQFVILEEGKGSIEEICERKNVLVRPPVANIDILVITISKKPSADLMLVDKLIIFCLENNIKPVICVAKDDLFTEKDRKEILSQYKDVVKNILFVSAKEKSNLESLIKLIKNKVTVFAGQSAVGKSSLINALTNSNIEVGEISEKTQRGKNTTRHIQLYFYNNLKIMDTVGFSSFDISIKSDDLALYYPDFEKYMHNCKYPMCTHTKEQENVCNIKKMVKEGKIDSRRYERYVKLYNEMKDGKPQKINLKNPTR